MASLVKGMSFLLEHSNRTCFEYREDEGKKMLGADDKESFPKLLVSIGSGVSIIKVNDIDKFERVSGTMIGGGTLVGLANLLINTNDFEEIQTLSK